MTVKAPLLSTLQQVETHFLNNFKGGGRVPADRKLHAKEKWILVTYSDGLNRKKASEFS